MKDNIHYKRIKAYYGPMRSKRSKLPYMNHIDEGLIILNTLRATIWEKQAYCIHPILQCDDALILARNPIIEDLSSFSLVLAMEYRSVANNYLPPNFKYGDREVKISILPGVNKMLIADKVQNFKDYELHQTRDSDLDGYFATWLDALGVSMDGYKELKEIIT